MQSLQIKGASKSIRLFVVALGAVVSITAGIWQIHTAAVST